MRRMLFLIDPQRGFTDPNIRKDYEYNDFLYEQVQELYVPGAEQDSIRTAALIDTFGKDDDIMVTLDSHYVNHIANYTSWLTKNSNGKWEPPAPYTMLSVEDVANGKFQIRNKALSKYSLDYVKKLRDNGRFALILWPLHCLIATPGFCIDKHIFASIVKWEITYGKVCVRVTKGSNYLTEHYSAVMADVPDPRDSSTSLNTALLSMLKGKTLIRNGKKEMVEYDEILSGGQAKSHCWKFTLEDIAEHIGPDVIPKFTLLEDATSPVETFEDVAEDFVKAMVKKGMKLAKTTDYI